MSIKDLFGKRSNQILTVEKYEETVKREGESLDHVEERTEDKARFVPRISVDFDDPKTFARYGSAEKYYVDAYNSIINSYPYDGSLAEKTAWHNGASYIDNYLFENEYPRTTGYLSFNTKDTVHVSTGAFDTGSTTYRYLDNPQFLYVKGGPNPTPINPTNELRKQYPEGLGRSNIWNPEKKRESNLYAEGDLGNTVEFWFKLDEERTEIDGNICFFDLWNNQQFGTDQYCRMLIEMPEDKDSTGPLFNVTYVSGSSGIESLPIGNREELPINFDLKSWNHFAVSVFNSNSSVCTRAYINGELIEEVESGTSVESFVGEKNHLTATINSLQYKVSDTEQNLYGFGAARASYDEFRFWKSARTSEQIGRKWFTQVYGGANTDEANTDLGVYFKFNEGIYDSEKISSFDRQTLDYSGRISNGSIVNYTLDVRKLGSAINEKPGINNDEFRDPIMYRDHPLVRGGLEDKRLEGSAHDFSNNAAIYNTMPEWITTADDEAGGQTLLNLTQIISSYFDTLHLQIEALPSLTNTHYAREGEKPLPFAKHLLESVGFVAPEIFVDTTVLEALMNRNEERVFEEKLHNVKNLIYQNIYNNVVGIYKSKGTEKSFRNLLRCFGIGDELIKINLYGDGAKFKIENNYRSVSVKKNYLDFNDPDRHDSTVYQSLEPDNEHSTSYVAGSEVGELDFIPFTLEASVIFPRKLEIDHPKYVPTNFGFTEEAPASIFGLHQAKDDESDLTWVDTPDIGFRVVSVKQDELSKDAKFRLDVRGFGIDPDSDYGYTEGFLETDYYHDVYDNTRWNFAVRVRTDKTPDLVYKSEENVRYFLEFYGVSTLLDEIEEQFMLEAEISADAAKAALNANKRVFLGAEYHHFNDNSSGNINRSDVKIGEVRYWQDYIDNETMILHSQDPDNYGVKDPYKPAYFNQTSTDRRVPQIDTLCLYWDFATVTLSSPSDGVDEAGNILSDSFFYVDDVSGGSNVEASPDGRYEWIGRILKKQHTAKGDYYYPEDRHVVDRNFLFAAKQNLPEIIGSSDTVNILTQDDEYFTKNTRPVNYFFAIEKSMYQAISQEIIEAFAGITAFNNLIGEPVNRYRMEYKNLNKLRQLFFQKFKEEPKIEKYIQFYKWIDSSIGEMIMQLIPASANFSDGMRTMIESHILERNKYWTKFPTLEMNQKPPETPLLGINEMLYNWRNGHASFEEDDRCLWWKLRAERNDLLSSGDDDIDADREQILKVATTKNDGDYIEKSLSFKQGGVTRSYSGQTFALRSLSTPYRFGMDVQKNVHGGVNNKKSKKIDYVRAELADDLDRKITIKPSLNPANYDCDDDLAVLHPLLNRRLNVEFEDKNARNFSLYELNQELESGKLYWNSNHSDSYGDDKEVPIQGVFPFIHVGGLQSRHVPLNDGTDTDDNRPEAWKFNLDGDEGTFEAIDLHSPKAKYYRDEKAKRPVNVRNIKSAYGNYRFDYQVVQTSSRRVNNRWMVEQEGLNAEGTYSTASPYVLGLYDFLLPDRGRQEHIFSERFSAPGSPDTLSRGMLDIEAEEYAVYNSLNFRNLDVRVHLKNWLTYHTKKFGYRSYYRGVPVDDCQSPGDTDVFCEANFHKHHRNSAYRPEPYDFIEFGADLNDNPLVEEDPCCECSDEEFADRMLTDYRCKEIRDNFWITHQLPRSGYQYSWIASSTQKEIFEDVNGEAKFYTVCPWGYATDFPNAIAYHPQIETSPIAMVGNISAYSKMVVQKELYPDSDTSVTYERVIMETGFPFLNNFLKYRGERHPKTFEQILQEENLGCSEIYEGSVISGMSITDPETYRLLESGEITLNEMLLHRDGPYQHPTWRQIRGYENPAVIKQRKKNVISTLKLPKVIRTESNSLSRFGLSRLSVFRQSRSEEVENFVEPAVSWNMPMKTKLNFFASPSSGTVVHTYSNNLEVFSNPYLDRRVGLKKTAKQVYDILIEQYLDPRKPYANKLFELSYSEYIFPKHRNAGLDKVRKRRFYGEMAGYDEYTGYDKRSSDIRTFWQTPELRERTTLMQSFDLENQTPALNALGATERRSSVWSLEYKNDVAGSLLHKDALRGDLAWAGSAQYRGYVMDAITDRQIENLETHQDAWLAPRPKLQFIHNPRALTDSYEEEAWVWKAADISQNQPWYNNYEEYSEDVRLIGQNFSLTPEFNISSHMSYYVNDNAGNFKANNKNILEIKGAGEKLTNSSIKASSSINYLSWDGASVLEEETNSFQQPNFATGWSRRLPAFHTNFISGDRVSFSKSLGGTLRDLSPEIQPVPVDRLALGLSSWSCAKPHSVFNFRPVSDADIIHGVNISFEDLSTDFTSSTLRGYSGEQARGLTYGGSKKLNWTESAFNGIDLLDRWQKSVMFSFWLKLDVGTEKSGMFTLTSNTTELPLTASTVGTYGKDREKISFEINELTSKINIKETKIKGLKKKLKIARSSSAKSVLLNRIKDLEKKLPYQIKKREANLKLIQTSPQLLSGKAVTSDFYFDTTDPDGFVDTDSSSQTRFGDLFWKDSLGNKLVFEVLKRDFHDWQNLSVYYIGGGEPQSETSSTLYADTLNRVIVFIKGQRVNSKMCQSTRDSKMFYKYLSDETSDLPIAEIVQDGSIFTRTPQRSVVSAAFTRMYFGASNTASARTSLNGQASDLMIFKGNPGITNIAVPMSSLEKERYEIKHWNREQNEWFFNRSHKKYYSKQGRVFSTLAELISIRHCKDANEVYEEWRELATVCNPSSTVIEIPKISEMSYIPLPSTFQIAGEQVSEKVAGISESIKQQLLSYDNEDSNDVNESEVITIYNKPQIKASTFQANIISRPADSLSSWGKHKSLDQITSEVTSALNSSELSAISDVVINTLKDRALYTDEDADDAACSKLIGWYKLGVPRWQRETCEEYVWNEDFFKCYAHTDKILHIEKIREDHKTLDNIGSATILKLEIDGVKKILPYNGFYPSQRVVQLGSLFYDSVMPYVEGENDDNLYGRARVEQAALQPFFAPGILFNTIKSGIAVDWAAYSSSEESLAYSLQCLVQRACQSAGGKLNSVLDMSVAKEINTLQLIGRAKTQTEMIQGIKESYQRNAARITSELKLISKSANRTADQQEYERFAQKKQLDPFDSKTIKQFKSVYSKQDFEANTVSSKLSVDAEAKSILGLPSNTSLSADMLSSAASKAIKNLSKIKAGLKSFEPDKYDFGIDNKTTSQYYPKFSNSHKYTTNGSYLNNTPSFRIPFEGLVSLDSYVPQKNSQEESKIFLLAPSYYESTLSGETDSPKWKYPYFEWTGEKSPLYEMAMNNFLAEVPNFFLSQGKFTTFASAPENRFKTVRKGWTYYMDVHLYKTDDFDMTISPHDGQLRKIGSDLAGREYTTQGRYYGPAVRYFNAESETEYNSADPAQAPYVPPYFYGRAKARLSFTAKESGRPSLNEILNNLEIEYINEEMDELFASRGSDGKYLASSIFKTAVGIESPSWKKTPAYAARMPMDACIKFDGRANEKRISFAAINTANDFTPDGVTRLSAQSVEDDNENTGVWVISPRFECPTFNFKTSENLTYRDENNCGTGIWGGYGTVPVETEQKEQGLFISIEESFKRHEMVGKPKKCRFSNEEIYSVAIGIGTDTRNLNENVIVLKDPTGKTYPISIGQPNNAIDNQNAGSWYSGELESEVSQIIGLGASYQPYSHGVLIRTAATSPSSSSQDPFAGMSGEYDIEAYLQSEAAMTDAFSLYSKKQKNVPKGGDVANAITYHINYKYNQDASFPWRANIAWVNRRDNAERAGASLVWTREANMTRKVDKYSKIANSLSAVVEIEYVPQDLSENSIKSINEIYEDLPAPTVELIVNQDPIKNPRGLLGLRYLTEAGTTDYSLTSQDPQSQINRSFYKKTGVNKIVECIETVGSLIDVCGFTATKSRIGEVAPSKEITEAVVMIPFVDNPIESQSVASTTQIAGKNFFQISNQLFSETKANVEAGKPAIPTNGAYRVAADISETSVSEMIKKMQKYNLPPQFDFFKYREINPFVMYIFEFKEVLDSDDLSNIWQGLMPERARTAQREVVSIEHEMNQVNFFEGKKIPENIRWMVFRVKKKAKTSYWEMTADSIDDDRFKFDFKFGTNLTPDYNYNWPYDFFSLVELCKIKGGISVVPRAESLELDTNERIDFEPIISTEQRRRLIDDAHAQAATSSKEIGIGLFNNLLQDEDE